MKRMLVVLLLVSASARANDLSDAWRSIGKNSRVASAVKAVLTGAGTIAGARVALRTLPKVTSSYNSAASWSDVLQGSCADNVMIVGSTTFSSAMLFYYFFLDHAKHTLGIKDGWFS